MIKSFWGGSMARGKGLGKTVALLFLIIILVLIGLIWFDYIGLIQAKSVFAPIYKVLGLEPQNSQSVTTPEIIADLDKDRMEKRLNSLESREQELAQKEQELAQKEQQIEQILQELEERKKSQEEREKTFNNTQKKYDDRNVNIVQNAKNLVGMEPEKAVAILLAMEDQDIIDVLRKTEELATEGGTMSMVSYWLSLMPPERVATIQRKMANKPVDIE